MLWWLLMQAIAIMDAHNGGSPQAWAEYINFTLPGVRDVCNPLLFTAEELQQLGDSKLVRVIQVTKVRPPPPQKNSNAES
jgi:hypothetical protein